MPRIRGWKDTNPIKANIVSYMILYGLDVPSVAKSIGMSQDCLYKSMNKPKQFRLIYLEKMAKLFKCRIEDIIYPKI